MVRRRRAALRAIARQFALVSWPYWPGKSRAHSLSRPDGMVAASGAEGKNHVMATRNRQSPRRPDKVRPYPLNHCHKSVSRPADDRSGCAIARELVPAGAIVSADDLADAAPHRFEPVAKRRQVPKSFEQAGTAVAGGLGDEAAARGRGLQMLREGDDMHRHPTVRQAHGGVALRTRPSLRGGRRGIGQDGAVCTLAPPAPRQSKLVTRNSSRHAANCAANTSPVWSPPELEATSGPHPSCRYRSRQPRSAAMAAPSPVAS